jgi:hypothetical protein
MFKKFVFLLFAAALLDQFIPAAQAADYKFSLEDYMDLHVRSHSDSNLNPNNHLFQLEDAGATNDLRPEVKLTTEHTTSVIRPRWIFSRWQWSEAESSYQKAAGRLDITDAFVEIRVTDSIRSTAGLEDFQWGPAELSNISNPLFHLNTMSRSSFYKEKGVATLRLSLDFTDLWNNMLIINPVSNNEPAFQEGQNFQPSGFIKSEIRSANDNGSSDGQTYLGVLGGTQPDARKFFGEYFSTRFDSGWSFYLEARHPFGQRRFELQTKSGIKTDQLISNENGMNTLSLAGLRWEGRVDARLEYFYNSDGFNSRDFRDQVDTLKSPSPETPLNYSRFLRPGLELYGQAYAYLSLRIPDLGKSNNLQLALRSLVSLQDGSSIAQISVDKPLNDSFVGLIEAFTSIGGNDQELTLLDRTAIIAGAKWSL